MRDLLRYSDEEEYEIIDKKPERETVIGGDDLLNLKIALELSSDVSDIFSDQHIFEQ